MKKISLFFLLTSLLCAVYIPNHKCKECHESIYDEYMHSAHSKTYFNDELHRKVADLADSKKYECAACHMPAASDIQALESGKERPNPRNVRESDAISCYFCHTIAFVKEAHRHNIIVPAKQAEGYKPSLYGNLENPDENDKHSCVHSPIYERYACVGCHSHKTNAHGVEIFRAMQPGESSESCIKCHMPKIPGGVEKMNKRDRGHHYSHYFRGIHDAKMRKEAVDINITAKKGSDRLIVTLHNRMPHPLIIQAARMKFLKIELKRDGKMIWKNFQKSPYEDRQGTFVIEFVDKNNNPVVIPSFAYGYGFKNNLAAKAVKKLVYKVPSLKRGDTIDATFWVYLVKPSCWSTLKLEDKDLIRPYLMKKIMRKVH